MNETTESGSSHKCDQCDWYTDHFCHPRAERVVKVFERILVHTKSRWAKKPFVLAPWQREEIIKPLFGTVKWSDEAEAYVRQYRIAWIELARKNGKSELLAGIALCLLVADDEEGAEIYSCAKDRDQARKVFDVAEQMVKLSPILNKRLKIYKQSKRIVDEKTGSYYEIISADAAGNLGHNPHGIIFDEVLTQPNDGLWNAMRTAMGARTQPLMVAATTAGNDPSGFCAAEHEYCERVQGNPELDPSRFVYLRNTPKDANWEDEENWYISNPALGSFLSIDALRDEAREAKNAPAKQNAFRQFRLNQWVQQSVRWIDMGQWKECEKDFKESDLYKQECYMGLDLATTSDISALALCFPQPDGVYKFLWRYWIPEDNLIGLDERTGGNASVWAREERLLLTEGNVIDYKAILEEIMHLNDSFDIREIGYDVWGMTQMSQDLTDLRFTVVPFNQQYRHMSAPSKEFEKLVVSQKLEHDGNPVTEWMANNVTVEFDSIGNIKPSKAKSHEKIDGIIAAVMALDRTQRMAGKKTHRRVVSW